jgi:ketol-acid reductoisomerase
MNYSVSDTAEYGGLTVGSKIITDETKQAMKAVLERVQNGEFAKEWIEESESGAKNLQALRDQDSAHPIEQVGKRLRDMMPFLK